MACVAAAVFAAVALYLHPWQSSPMAEKQITVGASALMVEVADTEPLREKGLSGRTGLAEGRGMLFVFEQDGEWGMWMKDMRFSIDIVWADASGTVVTVAQDVSPDTYPQAFLPSVPVRYVLEVPAGYTAQQGIAEGVKIVL